MSKLYDMRQALAARIISFNIGWTDQNILIKRQADLFNEIATKISAAKNPNRAVLHIGIAEGSSTEEDGLEMDLTLPLTIICVPKVVQGQRPEEDLWEDLVTHVHDLRIEEADHWNYRMRFAGFSDIDIEADSGSAWLGRQTIFKRRLSL